MSNQNLQEKVILIIPTYNEAAAIQETVESVFAAVSSQSAFDIHVLIFDSASTDNTVEIIQTLQNHFPNLHLQTEAKKTGLGSAYRQAMDYALHRLNADIVFEFDADLSHQPKYILPILNALQHTDCVIGSRYIKGGSIPKNWALHRKMLSVLGNYIARIFLTFKYKDFTSGFRATRRESLLKALPSQFLSAHYAYKLHLLWLLHTSAAKIVEFPIDFIDREKGESKLPKNSIVDSLRVILTLRYYSLQRYLKMCLVGASGMLIQLIVYNVLRLHFTPLHASQFAVLTAILSNFTLNSLFTFRSKKEKYAPSMKRLSHFLLYSLFIIFFQSYLLQIGTLYFGVGRLKENILLALAIGFGSFLNYLVYSRHIWRPLLPEKVHE